jgi:hypothetical protein
MEVKMPNGDFESVEAFRQFVKDKLVTLDSKVTNLPCKKHADELEQLKELRTKTETILSIIGVLIGGGIIGTLATLIWKVI